MHDQVSAAASMQIPVQIDEVHGGDGGGAYVISDQQSYDHGVHQKYGGDGMDDQNGVERDAMEGEMPSDAGNLAMIADPAIGNQLTLSFQGEVYVFDSVSPEKVTALSLSTITLFPLIISSYFAGASCTSSIGRTRIKHKCCCHSGIVKSK